MAAASVDPQPVRKVRKFIDELMDTAHEVSGLPRPESDELFRSIFREIELPSSKNAGFRARVQLRVDSPMQTIRLKKGAHRFIEDHFGGDVWYRVCKSSNYEFENGDKGCRATSTASLLPPQPPAPSRP